MTLTEIFEALELISEKPFDTEEFPFEFAQATDVAQAAIAKLRNGTTNKSDQPGGVLVNKKFHFAPALTGMADVTLEALRNSKKTATAKPAILIPAFRQISATCVPCSPCFRKNAFCASVNFDAFKRFCSSPSKERATDNLKGRMSFADFALGLLTFPLSCSA